jgi:hypothetical protein
VRNHHNDEGRKTYINGEQWEYGPARARAHERRERVRGGGAHTYCVKML